MGERKKEKCILFKREKKIWGREHTAVITDYARRPAAVHALSYWLRAANARGRRTSSVMFGHLRRGSAASVAWPRFPVRLPEPRNACSEQATREYLSHYASSSRHEWLVVDHRDRSVGVASIRFSFWERG